jgi:hypothetical protein
MTHRTVDDQSVSRCFLRASLAVGIGLLISAATPATLRAEGNVTAVVTNGDLVIRGDAASNALSVVEGDTVGTIAVGGFDGTTTVNGSLNAVMVSGVTGDVQIMLRGGDDQLALVDLAFVPIPGSLRIDTGPGDDAIDVDDSSVGEDVEANTGSGNDSFRISGARDLLVNTADGNDFVWLDGATVEGRATVRSGGGDDEVLVQFSTIGGETTVETRGGTDSLNILDSTFESSTTRHGGGGIDDRLTDEGLNEFNGPLTIAEFEIIEVLPPPP